MRTRARGSNWRWLTRNQLSYARLIATGTTGGRIAEATGLAVECLLSGPMGGDPQIASRCALGQVQALIFLVDPLTAIRMSRTSRACSAFAMSTTYPLPPTALRRPG